MKIEHLDWDSNFFGFKIGKTIIKSKDDLVAIQNDKSNSLDLIYLFSEHSVEGMNCMDEKVEFEKEIDFTKDYLSEDIVVWNKGMSIDLLQLALLSGHSSRFKKDLKLNHKFKELYTLWLEKSIKGELADYVLVSINNHEVSGFLTLKMYDKYSQIGLVAVTIGSQGKGIGTHLMKKAFQLTKENNKQLIRVVTQDENKGAMNYYAKSGFSIHKKEYIYHYWLKSSS